MMKRLKSIPSLSFLLGSIVGFIISLMSIGQVKEYYDYGYYDDYYDDYNDDIVFVRNTLLFTLSICASVLYMLNAAGDVYQCILIMKNNHHIHSLFHEEIACDSIAALTFGTAAIIDAWSSFQSDDISASAGIISSLIYLTSAVSSLLDFCCECERPSLTFTMIGDILFFIGSLIDVLISFVSDPDITYINPILLSYASLFSSSLWLSDAVFYVIADIVANYDDDSLSLEGTDTNMSVLLIINDANNSDSDYMSMEADDTREIDGIE